jgi:hypothetical protein
MHLDGGMTKVSLLRTEGKGLADGGITWEIPTSIIPMHLRTIGSYFVIVAPNLRPNTSDSIEAIREMIRQIRVEELPESERSKI